MAKICLNGKFMDASEPSLMADNRSYRFGDGFFETMLVRAGRLQLEDLHFERFNRSVALLQMHPPALLTRERLVSELLELARRNDALKLGRVRLSLFRGNGGILEESSEMQWLGECWPLNPSIDHFNENGLVAGIYPDARKAIDAFSGVKSSSFLPYVMAARYARANQWNEAIVLNTGGGIADACTTNLFVVKDRQIITPSIDQGCVAGVLRARLLQWLPANGYQVLERALMPAELATADEVWLTNCIRGIRWVQSIGDTHYSNQLAAAVYSGIRKQMS